MTPASPTPAKLVDQGQRSWKQGVLLALVLLVATVIAYWPAMHGGFVWDDNDHISENETLHSLHGLWDIWFKPGATCQYYPLTFTGFWAGYQLWGLNPFGYHLLNVLLHGVVAILLWQVLVRLKMPGAWLAGAIFALHPVCVMSVAWMTELKNTLSAALALAAGWAYLRFAGLGTYERAELPGSGNRSRSDWMFYALALVLFQLALFAKTAVSFLPVSLLLVTWWRRDRLVGRDVWPLIPMLCVVGAMGWLTFHIEHLHGAAGASFQMNFVDRLLVSGRSFWFYLWKLIFPQDLTFIYERWQVNRHLPWQYIFPVATVGALVGSWWFRRRLGRGLFVALMHFYVCTSLLILLVVLYMTRYSFVSDHWQYFGCMSVIAVVAAGIHAGISKALPAGSRRYSRLPVGATGGVVLLVLGVLTWRQCGMYADMETLWRTTLARSPRSTLAHNNLGELLAQRDQLAEAMNHFQKALEIQSDFPEAHYNLGNVLLRTGRTDEAISHFQKTLELQPDFAEAYNNLGNILAEQGRWDEAMSYFQKALAYQPDFAEAHYNLGKVLLRKGQIDDALVHLKTVLELQPDLAEGHNILGNALLQKGQVDAAVVHFQTAVKIQPDFASAYYNLGQVLFNSGRLAEAIVPFRKVVELQPDDAEAHHKLGMIFLRRKQPIEAMTYYEAAFRFQPDDIRIVSDLAWVLATCQNESVRNSARAIDLAQRANQLSGDRNPGVLGVLAAAYANGGRLADAIAMTERAIRLAGEEGNGALAERLRSQLKVYQAGSPIRE